MYVMKHGLWRLHNNDHSFLVPFTDISMQDKMVIYDNEKHMIGWGPGKCDQPPKSRSFRFGWCFVRFSDLHVYNGVWSQGIILQKETFSAVYCIGLEGNSSISTVHFIYISHVGMYVCMYVESRVLGISISNHIYWWKLYCIHLVTYEEYTDFFTMCWAQLWLSIYLIIFRDNLTLLL